MSTTSQPFALAPRARTFATPWDEPAVVQAASVAMALLRKTKVGSLADLNEAVRLRDATVLKALSGVNLTVRQRSLLTEFAAPLSLLRHNPNAHLLYCGTCGTHSLTSGAAPTKCQITYGCLSKDQHKSMFATYLPVDEPIPEAEHHPYQPEAGQPEADEDDGMFDDWADDSPDDDWGADDWTDPW